MASSQIRATITLDATQFNSTIKEVQGNLNKLNNDASKGSSSTVNAFQKMGETLANAGRTAILAGYGMQQAFKPLAGILTESVKVGREFESAFAGVRKTVGNVSYIDELKKACVELSRQMPETASDIAHVMAIAGQLGIRGSKNLQEFTKTAVMLGDTTNLSSTAASTALARFMNITGTAKDKVGNLGATLVDLGNKTATTESEIMNMSLRLAAASRQVGISDSDIMGFAATLTSLGIKAEMGGSAFSKLMINMEVACQTGGESLDNFAKVAGMSSDQFKQSFEKDATDAIVTFLKGLNSIEKNGGSMIATLDSMGIKEIRLRDTILRAAGAVGDMEKNLKTADSAYKNNTALVEEAEQRYNTLDSQVAMFKNNLAALGIKIYNSVKPALTTLVKWGNKVIDALDKVNPKVIAVVGVIGTVGVALGVITQQIGFLILGIGEAMKLFGSFTGAGGLLAKALGALTSPVGLVVAAIAALGAAFVYAWKNVDGFKEGVISAWSKIKSVVLPIVQELGKLVKNVFELMSNTITNNCKVIKSVVQTVWGWIGPFVTSVLKGMLTTVSDIFEGIGKMIETSLKFWNAIIEGDWGKAADIFEQGCKDIWECIKKWASDWWSAVKDAVKGMIDGFKQFVTDAPQIISDAWTAVKDKLSEWGEKGKKLLEDSAKAMYNGFCYVKDHLPEIISDTWSAIKDKLSEWSSNLKTTLENIGEAAALGFRVVKDKIAEKLDDAWDTIKTKLKDWAVSIPDKVKESCEAIVNGFLYVKDNLPAKLDEIKDSIKNKISEWKDAFVEKIDNIKTGIVEKLETWKTELPQKIEETKTELVNKLNNWVEELPQKMDDLKEALKNKVEEWKVAIPEKINEIKDKIIEKLNQWIEELPQKIEELMQGFCDSITGKKEDTGNAMGDVGDGLKEKIEEKSPSIISALGECLWELVKAIVKATPDILSALCDCWLEMAKSVWTDLIPALLSALWEALKSVGSAIINAIPDIKNKIVELWNACCDKTKECWNDIKSAVSDKWGEIKSAVSDKASDIWDAIVKPFKDAWDWIKTNVIDKISNGFANMDISIPKPELPSISTTFKTVAGALIPSFSWNAKGSFLDSATLIGAGEAGTEAILPLSNKRYMKPFSDAVSAGIIDNVGTTGNSGNVTNNFNISQLVVREEADIKKVSEELYRLQKRESRRRGVA